MWLYIVFLAVGIVVGLLGIVSHEASVILNNLTIVAVTATAIIANLIVPFAGFANNEKWQRLTIQYGPVAVLGLYVGLLVKTGSILGALALALSIVVHIAYWTSSIHSRQYRFDLFIKTLGMHMPQMCYVIALLNARRDSHIADAIISHLLHAKRPDLEGLEGTIPATTLREAESEVERKIPTG